MESTVIRIEGMHCQRCVKSLTEILADQPGVAKVEVSLEKGEALVEYELDRIDRDQLMHAIDGVGYEAA